MITIEFNSPLGMLRAEARGNGTSWLIDKLDQDGNYLEFLGYVMLDKPVMPYDISKAIYNAYMESCMQGDKRWV